MNNALINTLKASKDRPEFEPLREAVRQMGKQEEVRWEPINIQLPPLKPIICQLD